MSVRIKKRCRHEDKDEVIFYVRRRVGATGGARSRVHARPIAGARVGRCLLDDHIVDVHIGNLRKKLETDPAHPQYLETVRGVGYRFRRRRE